MTCKTSLCRFGTPGIDGICGTIGDPGIAGAAITEAFVKASCGTEFINGEPAAKAGVPMLIFEKSIVF
jgi:hypothetical protein